MAPQRGKGAFRQNSQLLTQPTVSHLKGSKRVHSGAILSNHCLGTYIYVTPKFMFQRGHTFIVLQNKKSRKSRQV